MDLVVLAGNATPTPQATSGFVCFLQGNGDGTFKSHRDLLIGQPDVLPEDMQVGDFNGDTISDLAITFGDYTSHSGNAVGQVGIFLGNGDGTFQQPYFLPTGSGGGDFRLAIGSLRSDGILDLVVAGTFDNEVNVFLGNGDGTFQSPVHYDAVSFRYANSQDIGGPDLSVALGDFINGGKTDVAACGWDLSILYNNGDGTFQAAQNYLTGDEASGSISAGDLTRDGLADVVVTSYSGFTQPSVDVHMAIGDGKFAAPVSYPVDPTPRAVLLADLTGNGLPDIILTDYYYTNGTSILHSGINVLMNNGDGTFASPVSYASQGQGPAAWPWATSPTTATWILSQPMRATIVSSSSWATATAHSRPPSILLLPARA